MAQTILELQLKGVKEAKADMQRLSEEILYQKKVQATLKDEMKLTEKQFDEGKISSDDYKKSMAQLNTELETSKKVTRDNTAQLKQNIRVTQAQEGSLDQLRASLNLLQKEYGQINKETDEGAAKAADYADRIEQLTLEVKSQEKAIGDTRRNVGNYEEAIQSAVGSMIPFGGQLQEITASGGGVKGALASITTGIQGATRAAIAFIATPIGAAIAALAAIGAATKAFFDYNAEVQKTNALISGLTNESGALVDQIRIQSDAISQTLGVEQEQLVQSAKVLVQQFGISYDEALTKIQNGLLATNGANDEFLQSIGEYSTFFADAGYSVEEFANIVNAGFDLGIYTDKLPDALKEADISLREQTSATRDALINAFGEDFTSNILNQINTGAMSTKEALELMSQEAENVGLSAEQAATLTADVFRGAGEDAGGALKVFEAVNVSLSDTTSELDEQGKRMEADIARQQKVAEARDKAFNSEGVQSFMKVLKDLGAFLSKVFFGTIQALSFIIDNSLIKPIQFVVEQFNNLKEAASSALAPLKSITNALGITSNETDRATKSTGEFAKMLKEKKQAAEDAAAAQAQLEANTIAAEQALQDAKDRADEYVGSLRDIVAEQARQPLLLQAEDIFSDRNAEQVLGNLENVANQIEQNANITTVTVEGLSLSIEEYTQLAQDRLRAIEREESNSSSNRSSRTSTAMSESEKLAQQQAQEALDRIKALKDIVNAETERTLAEEELIDKRFYDKLRELDLDKDISQMTADELAARTALYAKYNDDLAELRDKNEADELATTKETFDKNLKAIQDGLSTELLIKETAMLNELRNEKLTEEQKLALQEQFQNESLELQKDALIKQMELIESTLGDGETTAALEQLRNALAGINLEIQNAGKDEDGEPKTLADRLGLNEEQVAKINQGVAGVEAGLDAMTQLTQAKAAERLANVDQMLQQGVINEEEAEKKKEQIKKEAARKQQKIDIVQAVINTAKAVTAALNTQPFLPAGLIMAGIATAQGAAQIKMIRSQKFADGGVLNGPSHAQGGIPMFSKGGAFYGEAEGGEAVLTKGVMANPALASMASAINVAGGGVPFFANGGVLDPIQSATPTDRAADLISAGMKSRQPVLVVEQLRERENSVDVIESLRTIG